MRDDSESGDEEALISSLAHSTLTHVLSSVKHSEIHLETTLSPSGPVCSQKKALLIGIQYYNSTNAQLDGEDRLDTPAGGQLKGPHVDVQNMRQLLLGRTFRRYPFSQLSKIGITFFCRLLWLQLRRYHCAY